jgi:membrane protein
MRYLLTRLARTMGKAYALLKSTVSSFIDDEILTRGAAISFYTVTTFAPLLLLVVAIAGFFFGQEASQGAIVAQLSGLMGQETAAFFQSILANASNPGSGALSTAVGVAALLVTATGVFGEMQSALNTIWKVETKASTFSRLVQARAASLGLVVVLGFLLVVSLVVSAVLTALGGYIAERFPSGAVLMPVINTAISFGLVTLLFGAIFKVLPDRQLEWRDVAIGAVASSLLFLIGKVLIAWYLGSSGVASAYGAAGALILLLLWVFYSVQILLIGAEFTKAYANAHGSRVDKPVEAVKVVRL